MYMQTYYNCSGPPRSKEKHKKKKKFVSTAQSGQLTLF